MALFSLYTVVIQISSQVTALIFLNDPSKTLSGHTFLPPDGDSVHSCSTDKPANITWMAESEYEPRVFGPGLDGLNISQVSERKSVLYVRSDDYKAKGILIVKRKFYCHAKDSVNRIEIRSKTFVFERGERPAFKSQSGNVQVKEGQETELKCSISASLVPFPSVIWICQKDNREFPIERTRVDMLPQEDAFILKVRGLRNESGIYKCKATNQFGFATSDPITVTVTYFDENKFTFTIKPKKAKQNQPVLLSVKISARPKPSNITITKNGRVIASTENRNDIEYVMKAKKDMTGSYSATALHLLLNYTQTRHLTVLSQPSEVDFTVASVFTGSFSYTWTVGFDGNSPVVSSTMCCSDKYYATRNVCCPMGISKTMMVRRRTVENTMDELTSDDVYYCQLFATNVLGSSGSKTKEVKLPTVPGMPTVACQNIGETSMTVNWTDRSTGGDKILKYDVFYTAASKTIRLNFSSHNEFLSGGSCQLEGLMKMTQYFIEVAAMNSVKSSLPGTAICNTICIVHFDLRNVAESLLIRLDGYVLVKFNISDECGSLRRADIKQCGEESHLDSSISHQSDTEVWVTVKGLKTGRNCITATVATDEGFVESRSFTVTIEKEAAQIVAVFVAVVVSCSVSMIVWLLCRKFQTGRINKEKNALRKLKE